jgi:hypothetical protein
MSGKWGPRSLGLARQSVNARLALRVLQALNELSTDSSNSGGFINASLLARAIERPDGEYKLNGVH